MVEDLAQIGPNGLNLADTVNLQNTQIYSLLADSILVMHLICSTRYCRDTHMQMVQVR